MVEGMCVHITEMTQLRFIQIEARVHCNCMSMHVRSQLKSFLFKLVQLLSAYSCPRAISLCSGFVDSLADDSLIIKNSDIYCLLLHNHFVLNIFLSHKLK